MSKGVLNRSGFVIDFSFRLQDQKTGVQWAHRLEAQSITVRRLDERGVKVKRACDGMRKGMHTYTITPGNMVFTRFPKVHYAFDASRQIGCIGWRANLVSEDPNRPAVRQLAEHP